VKRRAFLVVTAMAITSIASAQTAPTQTQIDLALGYASLRALLVRYGDRHPDVAAARARVESLSTSIRAAHTHGDAIDRDAVMHVLDAEIADVRARIAERSTRCGAGHPDMQTAVAREAALTEALTHVTSDGYFVPLL
jgi:uncharacterized protein involved in exopolysaccharide biosynthesis